MACVPICASGRFLVTAATAAGLRGAAEQAENGRLHALDLFDCELRTADNLRAMKDQGGEHEGVGRARRGSASAPAATLTAPAPPCIADVLRRARLLHWVDAAQDWAQRFGGIDRVAHADEIAPGRCVMKLARRYARLAIAPSDAQVAQDLACLPFTRWHARWPAWATPDGVNRSWRPLEEAFCTFAARYDRADALVVWEGTVPVVALDVAAAHLLAQVGPANTGSVG